MKKFNILALAVLSIVLVTGCGDDKKKKKVGLSFIGPMNAATCQPLNPQAIPQQAYLFIQQECQKQASVQNSPLRQLMQNRSMTGQPMNYNATYIIPPNPYGYAQPTSQTFFNQQQPYAAQQQVQMTGVTFY